MLMILSAFVPDFLIGVSIYQHFDVVRFRAPMHLYHLVFSRASGKGADLSFFVFQKAVRICLSASEILPFLQLYFEAYTMELNNSELLLLNAVANFVWDVYCRMVPICSFGPSPNFFRSR